MKRITFFSLLLAVCTVSLLMSCDKESTEIDDPSDNLSKESKQFVGLWKDKNSALEFVFFGDGYCLSLSKDRYDNIIRSYGYWTYDSKTSVLATTADDYQWEITLQNPLEWGGVRLGSSSYTDSYKKATKCEHIQTTLSRTKWVSTVSSDSIISLGDWQIYQSSTTTSKTGYTYYFPLSGYKYNGSDSKREYTGYDLVVTEDENENDDTYNFKIYGVYYYYWSSRYNTESYRYADALVSGTMTVKNATSRNKRSLVFEDEKNLFTGRFDLIDDSWEK